MLTPEQDSLYRQHRATLRRNYLLFIQATIGIESWNEFNDRYFDGLEFEMQDAFRALGLALPDVPAGTAPVEDEVKIT